MAVANDGVVSFFPESEISACRPTAVSIVLQLPGEIRTTG